MKRIRLGNTIDIVWEIFLGKDNNKGKYDLTGKKLTIYLVSAFDRIKISDFTTEFNVLRFTFEGKDQKHAGRYQMTFVENEGGDDTRTLDKCDAFELVRGSCIETDDLSEITLTSSFDALRIYPIVPQVGPNGNWWVDGVDTGKSSVGLTAYEFAKEQGYEGTEEEYAAECLAVPVLNEESRTATAEAREATEESIAQHESVSNYMNDVAEPTVAAAAQIAKDVRSEADAVLEEVDAAIESVNEAAESANRAASNATSAATRAETEANKAERNLSQINSYMSGTVNPAVAQARNAATEAMEAASKAAKDVQAAIDEIDPVLNGKADKVQFEGKSYVETDGISTDDFYYSMPDSADGTEDDIIATKSNLKKINGQDLYGKGNIVIEGKNYDNEISALQQKDTQTETAIARNTAQITQVGRDVAETDTKLTELSQEIDTFFPPEGNLYTGEMVEAYIHSELGVLTPLATARTSVPIPVISGKVYCISGRNSDTASIRCIDSEGKSLKVLSAKTREQYDFNWYLPNLDATDQSYNGQFAVPEGAVAVQFAITFAATSYSNEIVLEYVGDEYSADFVPSSFDGYDNVAKRLGVKYIPSELTQEIHDIQEKVAEIEDAVLVSKTLDLQGKNNYAYTMVVGSAPVGAARADYIAFVAEGLKKGDIIIPKTQTGSSVNSYAKVKEGIIIEVGAKSVALNSPIECDGSFDAFYINNYTGYVFTPSCQLVKKVPISDVIEQKSIKILCFGNSFTQDSMSYVPFILKNIAPNLDVTIGIAYIGGCPLAQHCANLTGESVTSGGTTYTPTTYTLYIYKNGADSWNSKASQSADALLALEEWDVITFQQAGSYAAQSWETYYAPFIYKIHKAIFDKVKNSVKLGWLSIHGAYGNNVESLKTLWEQTTENTKKVQNLTGNEVVFPFGTAVQNLSTIASLADIGDGAGMTADGGHLHEGLPCLTAAYANALTILREAGIEWKSIIGEGTRPTKEWCNAIGVPGTNYGATTNDVVGVTDANVYYAQVAAIQAVKQPYELTDISMIL